MGQTFKWEQATKKDLVRDRGGIRRDDAKSSAERGPTGKQTATIKRLRKAAGVRKGPMPVTLIGASHEIERLLGMLEKQKERRDRRVFRNGELVPERKPRPVQSSFKGLERSGLSWPARSHTEGWATPEQMAVIEDAMRRKKR